MAFPTRRHATVALAAFALALAAGAPAQAQGWPDKPLRIMVGASPGGGTDILARMLAEKFAAAFRSRWWSRTAPAPPTRSRPTSPRTPRPTATRCCSPPTPGQAIAPHLLKLKFDPLKDLQPIGLVAVMPNVLVVSAASPYRSAKDLVAAMADKPGQLKYASSGIGSTQHIAGEAFALATGTEGDPRPLQGQLAGAHRHHRRRRSP
jgi:tripartite-type tricarboxylate transporter receptor subunit TctC